MPEKRLVHEILTEESLRSTDEPEMAIKRVAREYNGPLFYTMPELIKYLDNEACTRIKPLTISDIDMACSPMYDKMGISRDNRKLLDELALSGDDFKIHGNKMLKHFGAIGENQDAAQIKKFICRANLLGPKYDTPKSQNFYGIIKQGQFCKVEKTQEQIVGRDGIPRLHDVIIYWLNCESFHTALARCKKDEYARYFSRQWRVSAMVKNHQEKHARIQAERKSAETIKKLETSESIQDTIFKRLADMDAKLDQSNANHMVTQKKLDQSKTITENVLSIVESLSNKAKDLNYALIMKSRESTMNPINSKLHHGYAVIRQVINDVHQFVCIGGQRKYVEAKLKNHKKNGYSIAIDFSYNANPIDFRNNVCTAGHQLIEDTIERVFKEWLDKVFRQQRITIEKIVGYEQKKIEALKDEEKYYELELKQWEDNGRLGKKPEKMSDQCQELIDLYNSSLGIPPNIQRLKASDIPVSFKASVYTWKQNDYISYGAFMKLFDDVHSQTQTSPVNYDPTDFTIPDFDGLDEE